MSDVALVEALVPLAKVVHDTCSQNMKVCMGKTLRSSWRVIGARGQVFDVWTCCSHHHSQFIKRFKIPVGGGLTWRSNIGHLTRDRLWLFPPLPQKVLDEVQPFYEAYLAQKQRRSGGWEADHPEWRNW